MANAHDDGLLALAERELAAARARARDLEGFVRVYRELVTTSTSSPVPEDGPSARATSSGAVSRPPVSLADSELSIADASEKVLRAVGRPMKARDIAERLLDWGFPYSAGLQKLRSSVGGVLSRKVGSRDSFSRPKPGMFALLEWEAAEPQDQDTAVSAEHDEDVRKGGELLLGERVQGAVRPVHSNSSEGPNPDERDLGNGSGAGPNRTPLHSSRDYVVPRGT